MAASGTGDAYASSSMIPSIHTSEAKESEKVGCVDAAAKRTWAHASTKHPR